MIEHVGLHATDFATSKKFYQKALAPLGYRVAMSVPNAAGFMAEGHTSFWVSKGEIGTPSHLAFRAKDRKMVDAFHKAALRAGGKDNGAPGLRKDYSPTYYAAFVLDPDGHNIEAVTFARGPSTRAKPSSRAKPSAAKARTTRAPAAKPRAARAKKPAARPARKAASARRTARR